MLVLTRKLGEKIKVGDSVEIVVLKTSGSRVIIGIEAPRQMLIVRGELRPRSRATLHDEMPMNPQPLSMKP